MIAEEPSEFRYKLDDVLMEIAILESNVRPAQIICIKSFDWYISCFPEMTQTVPSPHSTNTISENVSRVYPSARYLPGMRCTSKEPYISRFLSSNKSEKPVTVSLCTALADSKVVQQSPRKDGSMDVAGV